MNSKNKNLTKHTYVNPLPLPQIPFGTDEWCKEQRGIFDGYNKPDDNKTPDYRSISDPTVFWWDNKWYMYPSYGMAWVTEDFENWKHVPTSPFNPKYSPTIAPWKDGKFLLTSWYCPLYEADSPLGPFRELGEFVMPDGTKFMPLDPGIFADDDGRLYLYEVKDGPSNSPVGFSINIVGYELDKDEPTKIIRGPVDIVLMDPLTKPWERHGLNNQDPTFGWCEGPHLLKYNGRYYMIYAAPDTCDASYCLAVYYSDVSPLYGFKCQKKNPLTTSRHGVVSGAGHGSVERGPNGTLWAFYTIAAPYVQRYERRIGMDMVAVDENGELYCPFGVTDVPQYIPGFTKNPLENGNSPKLLNLTAAVRPTVSSASEGRDAVYATDGNNLSFWMPSDGDENPCIECDLSGLFSVGAARIWWREIGLNVKEGILPEPIKYLLEGYDGEKWVVLADKRDNQEEINVEYVSFELKKCRKVKLAITGKNPLTRVGMIDFAVFGKFSEDL